MASLPSAVAGGALAASSGIVNSTLAGIVIFAIGILVGFVSVWLTDAFVRRRLGRAYTDWVRDGSLERRDGHDGTRADRQ